MSLTTLSIQPTLNNIVAQAIVNDTTDYTAAGYDPSNASFSIKGWLKLDVTYSQGSQTVYNNLSGVTPDFDINSATTNVIPILLPRDADQNPLPGTYTFTLQTIVYDDNNVQVDTLTQSFVYDYQLDIPVVCLSQTTNCQQSTITSLDSTEYGSYASAYSRVHSLIPPGGSPLTTVTGSQPILVAGPNIYDHTWTQKISTTVTYTFPDGLIAIILVEGSREFKVICDIGLSKLACCLNKVYKKMFTLETQNNADYQAYKAQTIIPLVAAMEAYNAMISAGEETKAAQWYDKIVQISECGDECGCSDASPQEVVPSFGAGGNTFVTSPGNTLKVIPVVNGNDTTWQVDISDQILQIINGLYVVSGITATPTYLTVTNLGAGFNREIKIDFNPAGITAALQSVVQKTIEIVPGAASGGNYQSLGTVTSVNCYGANVDNTIANHIILLGENNPNNATDFAVLRVSGILAVGTNPSGIEPRIVKSQSGTPQYSDLNDLDIRCIDVNTTTGDMSFALFNPQTGVTYQLSDIATGGFGTILIDLTITA